jgi:1,4-dihydroxy-2-naphthoyl-CoA hydrolase
MSDNQPPAQPDAPAAASPDVLTQMTQGALSDTMGIQIRQASPDLVIGTMPVAGNTQPYGLLHGGASCVLAETLGSIGAALHGARQGKIAVGIEINATHHRGLQSGTVTGTARPIHLGGTLATYEVSIVDERERKVCTARLTCMLRSATRD